MDSEIVANKLIAQKKQASDLRAENKRLREELQTLQKRAAAENILVRAKDCKDAPSKLRPADLDDFLAKRAMLEEQSNEELEKTAGVVDYLDGEGDGFHLDFDDSPSSAAGAAEGFNNFLRQHI